MTAPIAIVPQPVEVIPQPGIFRLLAGTRLVAEAGASHPENAMVVLQDRVRRASGWELPSAAVSSGELETSGAITFRHPVSSTIPNQGYELDVHPDRVDVRAVDGSGFLFAVQTLLQLLPPAVYGDGRAPLALEAPCVRVRDYPRFRWRGMMLDCSRHFFPAETIRRFIDGLAVHKMNLFHWHLTDDEGWRIEIRRYPKLTEVGAWRGKDEKLRPSHGSGKDRYGGFYTQAEIREIVAYAGARGITIMPEIDLPAHSRAAVVSYPELLVDPEDCSEYSSVQGLGGNVLDPGLESTFDFVEGVLEVVAELFPGPFLHIGGDERPAGAWLKSPASLRRMQEEGLADADALQRYFTQRVGRMVDRLGRTLVGWEEMIKGGSPSNSLNIVSWTGTKPGIRAIELGASVFMAPAPYLYLDMACDDSPEEPGLRWAKTVSTEKVYSYDPTAGLPDPSGVVGILAPLWSETLTGPDRVDYMAYPRGAAAAEVGWTPQEKRDWPEFNIRLHCYHLARLDAMGIQYRIPTASAKLADWKQIEVLPPYPGADIRYTTDGSDPSMESPRATDIMRLQTGDLLTLRVAAPNGRLGRAVTVVPDILVGSWSGGDLDPDGVEMEWDISYAVRRPALYRLTVREGDSACRCKLKSAALRCDGVVIDETPVGDESRSSVCLRIEEDRFCPASQYFLRATIEGSCSATGSILMAPEPLHPRVRVETSFEDIDADHTPEHAADWNIGTYFRSNRPGRAGDHVSVYFEKPVKGRLVRIATGTYDAVHEVLPCGLLEIAGESGHFIPAAEVWTAEMTVALEPDREVCALRLRAVEDMRTCLSVRELHLE